ncbi:histone H3-like centromeric protein cnp1 [Contarinia nasturtii]|uniref:histone H3-like centromeric protein cnp1 n=1 Tax=Contarinia nasturtii TaxID=265458 RepID=UPI0012D4396E|nr:histone H3-like centromeric protein cnp1 [Contarinia nasturtii]
MELPNSKLSVFNVFDIDAPPTPDNVFDAGAGEAFNQAAVESSLDDPPTHEIQFTRTAPSNNATSGVDKNEYIKFVQKQMNDKTITDVKEIHRYQRSTDLLIPRSIFQRIVRVMLFRFNVFSMQVGALEALQQSTESYIVELFYDAAMIASHAGRTTVLLEDLLPAKRLRN